MIHSVSVSPDDALGDEPGTELGVALGAAKVYALGQRRSDALGTSVDNELGLLLGNCSTLHSESYWAIHSALLTECHWVRRSVLNYDRARARRLAGHSTRRREGSSTQAESWGLHLARS
jgi:hypothetical protein